MNNQEFTMLSAEQMAHELTMANAAYRTGEPLMSDARYDEFRGLMVARYPDHPFLNSVEPDVLLDGKGRVPHPKPMLSTDKAYSWDEVIKWAKKAVELAKDAGVDAINIRLTPKLDGCAGRYAPEQKARFVTRGDGQFGNDFTTLGDKLVIFGDATTESVGEVICNEAYYQDVLKPLDVKHPRNFISGLIGADTLSPIAIKALADGAVHFVSYTNMEGTRTFAVDEFIALGDELGAIEQEIIAQCPYRTDGIVIQVDDNDLFAQLGHNNSFHYGQIAKKIAGEAVEAIVLGVTYQLGRTGRATPVINIVPTEISGVLVSNVTGHHAGNVKRLGLGEGAVIECIRSGDVIPFLKSVLKPAKQADEITQCPSCDSDVVWVNDFVECQNVDCKGRIAAQMQFFTKTLNWDLIGGKAAEKLAENGVDAQGLLTVSEGELVLMGFGAGQAKNIVKERERVLRSPIEDAKLLASVGIRMLGQRASRTLLKEKPLLEVCDFTVQEITDIEGFAEKKAAVIQAGLQKQSEFIKLLADSFADVQSSKVDVTESPITGKNIVFTGAMVLGNRTEMTKHAESLGANVQSSVSSKTDFLIIGEKVGAAKIAKAEKHGVDVINEKAYLALIKDF